MAKSCQLCSNDHSCLCDAGLCAANGSSDSSYLPLRCVFHVRCSLLLGRKPGSAACPWFPTFSRFCRSFETLLGSPCNPCATPKLPGPCIFLHVAIRCPGPGTGEQVGNATMGCQHRRCQVSEFPKVARNHKHRRWCVAIPGRRRIPGRCHRAARNDRFTPIIEICTGGLLVRCLFPS